MSDLSLNPQLGARLKGLQMVWQHDTPGETLATIFDAIINNWTVHTPSNTDNSVAIALKVRLKARHCAYFTQMSQLTGCSVPELARSTLIQWLCFPYKMQSSHQPPQMLLESPQVSPKKQQMLPSKTKKTTKKHQKVLQPAQPQQETTTDDEKPTTKEEKPATTGRTALSGLLKK